MEKLSFIEVDSQFKNLVIFRVVILRLKVLIYKVFNNRKCLKFKEMYFYKMNL